MRLSVAQVRAMHIIRDILDEEPSIVCPWCVSVEYHRRDCEVVSLISHLVENTRVESWWSYLWRRITGGA